LQLPAKIHTHTHTGSGNSPDSEDWQLHFTGAGNFREVRSA